ncbi:phosphoglycerate kinase, partial [Salmonella enterica subsp. enterica serovar Kentucky]|nr:phosphoglycerate kinase [Salmonella enterica subsp. enterica serovar Kentucky]
LPTIELALKQGAKVMVTSHLGRPTEGEYNEEFSLLPVVNYLKQTQRHDAIIELVKKQGYVSTEELVEHFSVSPQTIRRDLNDL